MTNDPAREHLQDRRLLRALSPSSLAIHGFRSVIEGIRDVDFGEGTRLGDQCRFLIINSTEADCEMLAGDDDRCMVLDAAVFDLLHATNALNAKRPGDRAHISIAAELLGGFKLRSGDFCGALFCADAAAHFRGDVIRLLEGFVADETLLFFQVAFVVLHETYHWALSKFEDLRASAESIYQSVLMPAASAHLQSALSEQNVARLAGPFKSSLTGPFRGDLHKQAHCWLKEHCEEVLCDFLALRSILKNLPAQELAGTAIFGCASVPFVIELRKLCEALSGPTPPSNWDAADRPSRYLAFTAVAHAAVLEARVGYEAGDLRQKMLEHMTFGVGAIETGLNQVKTNLQNVRSTTGFTSLEALGTRENHKAARRAYGILSGKALDAGIVAL